MAPALKIDRLSRKGRDRCEMTAVGRVDTTGIRVPLVFFNTLSVPWRLRVCSVDGLSCMASAGPSLLSPPGHREMTEGAATRRL